MLIKLENLKIGMILKNYRELCRVLGVNVTTGAAKQRQLDWFGEYFAYKKDGHKFIITEIYNKEIKPMQDNRGGSYNTAEYIENIEKLILDILVQDRNEGKIFLSKNKFFHALEMVNVNYLDCNRRLSKLSKYLDINEENVQEWFDTTGGVLERSLESALRNLAKQALVNWSKEITVCVLEPIPNSEYIITIKHKDKYGNENPQYIIQTMTKQVIREATDSEKKFILKTERDILLQLECYDKQEIVRKGLWHEFDENVKNIIKKEYDILYYYQSYKILSNPEHIQMKWDQVNLLLDNKERVKQKTKVNELLMGRLEDNAKSRQNNAVDKLECTDLDLYREPTLNRRIDEKYLQDNIKLNKTLINKKAKDIRNEVKKVKLDEVESVKINNKEND